VQIVYVLIKSEKQSLLYEHLQKTLTMNKEFDL